MLCPTCQTELNMSERQGIEIDYCPKCRGVWLDRGELDKIIERSLASPAQMPVSQAPPVPHMPLPPVPPYAMQQHPGGYVRDPDSDYDTHNRSQYPPDPYQKKKRKSLLGDLFDF